MFVVAMLGIDPTTLELNSIIVEGTLFSGDWCIKLDNNYTNT